MGFFIQQIMARPKKDNADYFSHDADMRNDAKIKALRRKFKVEGYGIWNMILEHLTDTNHFKYEYNDFNLELLAGDFDVDPKLLKEIIEYCILLQLLENKEGYIYSQKLIDRFESLLNKRKRDVNPIVKELSTSITPQNEVIVIDNPQSKVKESKVNNNTNIYSEVEFLERWKKARLHYDKQPTNITKLTGFEKIAFKNICNSYTPKEIDNAIAGLFQQKTYPATRLRPSHFLELEHFEKYLTCWVTKEKLYDTKNKRPIERI